MINALTADQPAFPDGSYADRARSLIEQHADYFREMDMRLALQGRATRSRPLLKVVAARRSRHPRQLALPLRPTMRR